MTDIKQYTLEELKEKLIAMTMRYVEMKAHNNAESRELKDQITILQRSIFALIAEKIETDMLELILSWE